MKIKGQLIDAQAENVEVTPAAGKYGRIVFDTTTKRLAIDNGTNFSEVVTASEVADLVNKSIDATENTITNVSNENIASDAGIFRSKIASGTSSHVLINDGSGKLSSEQQLAKSRGGTGADNTNVTFPSSGTLATTEVIATTYGPAVTQTLTNKTIDADQNTITNIANANIKALAAIDYEKLNLTGKIKSADLLGAIDDAKLAVISTAGKVSNVATTATPNNTVNAIVSRDSAGAFKLSALELQELASTPASPSAGYRKLYAKTTGKAYTLSSTGTETLIGSGSGGGSKNYISDGDGEAGAIGVGYSDTAVPTSVVSGGVNRISVTTVDPLSGTQSLLFTPGSAIGGQAIGFTIDREDFGRILQGDISLELGGTGYANGLLQFWIVAPSGAVIQPAGYSVLNATGPGKVRFTFQSESTGTQYYLKVHQTSTVSTWTAKMEIKLGPQVVSTGAFVSDPVTTPITFGASVTPPTKGTVVTDRMTTWREGKHLYMRLEYSQTAAGSAGSGIYLFPIPSGLQIDSTQVDFASVATNRVIGTNLGDAGTFDGTNVYDGFVTAYNATNLAIYAGPQANAVGTTAPLCSLSGATARFGFTAVVPIAGWGSSQVLSQDAGDGRVVSFYGTNNATTSFSSTTITLPFTALRDSVGAFAGSTYTVPSPGDYEISALIPVNATTSGANVFVNILLNGTSVARTYQTAAAANVALVVPVAFEGTLKNPDTIQVTVQNTSGGTIALMGSTVNSPATLTIKKISSGNQQIAASETIAASYWVSANTSITNGAVINFDSKEYDYYGAVTVGASWKFTAPAPGLYQVGSNMGVSGANANFAVFKGGALAKGMGGGTSAVTANLGTTIRLLAGESIDIRPNANSTIFGGSLASPQTTNINITRIGNY